MRFPQTVTSQFLAEPEPPAARRRVAAALPGRPSAINRPPVRVPAPPPEEPAEVRLRVAPGEHQIRRLLREWLMELKVMGRSPKTIDWYRQKVEFYLDHEGGPEYLEDLTSFELKRLLGSLQDRGLTPNTVHGYFEVLRAFCNWALREGYPVDLAVIRMRAPKVPQQEMETYSEAQLKAILTAAAPGWPRLAVQILLGTGMRVGELVGLELSDYDDEADIAFLKVRRGKGAKFRRVPVSSQLRREIDRYLNRVRADSDAQQLLLLNDGRPMALMTVQHLFQRIAARVGFRVHAHKFRHTFATGYLQRGGEIERLRRILGHTTYVMVMRYLHLDKGDLGRDFDARAPF